MFALRRRVDGSSEIDHGARSERLSADRAVGEDAKILQAVPYVEKDATCAGETRQRRGQDWDMWLVVRGRKVGFRQWSPLETDGCETIVEIVPDTYCKGHLARSIWVRA